jgi:hypothetical protein
MPGIAARLGRNQKASTTGVFRYEWLTAHDLDRANDHSPGKGIDIDAKLGGDESLLFRFNPLQPGVDINSLVALGGPPGASLDGLVTSENQLCPRLPDTEGFHGSLLAQELDGSVCHPVRAHAPHADVMAD